MYADAVAEQRGASVHRHSWSRQPPDPSVTAALSRATAPFLLVGGTADTWWHAEAARRLSPYLLQVDGADHGMFVPGAITNSIAVLSSIVATANTFFDAIGWPG